MTQAFLNKSNPDKIALITSNDKITYRQFFRHIGQFAQLFESKAYTKVAIYAENSPSWIYAFYAALQNQCIAIPIDFMASPDDVAYIIDDCQPELLFASSAMLEALDKINKKTKHKPEVLIFEDILPDENIPESQWIGPEDNETTAVIIYTSGTTGSPKGVMLSYTNIHLNMASVIDCKIFIPERQVMIFLPLHHIFPLVGSMITPLFVGSTVVLAPSMQSADLMKTFTDNEVGVFLGVPRLYELMYRGIKAKIDKSAVGKALLWMVMKTGNRNLGKKIFKKVHQGFGGNLQFMIAGGGSIEQRSWSFLLRNWLRHSRRLWHDRGCSNDHFPAPGKSKNRFDRRSADWPSG